MPGGVESLPIKFGFWNVEGLYEKLHLNDLCDFIGTFDIIGLGETFTLPGFDFSLKFPDYFALHCPATKYSKLGRPSGGLVLLIKKKFEKFIELVDTQISHVLAIKISKTLFNTNKDILLIMMYNHPRESIFYKHKGYYSTLEEVDQFIANQIEKGQEFNLLLGGDLNARIGDWAYTEDDEDELDTKENSITYNRESQDTQVNIAGRTLIEICTTYGLTSLSGLKEKNFTSKFTFIGHRGSSIVDHFISSIELLDNIQDFRTMDKIESNHLPIMLAIESNMDKSEQPETISKEPYKKYKWQDSKSTECQNILNKNKTKKLLEQADNLIETDIDTSLNFFNQAMEEINKPMVQTVNPNKDKKKEKNAWFDKECLQSKKETKSSLQKLNRTNRKTNQELYEERKQSYLDKKLQYNKLIKEKKKAYKKETQEQLIENRKDSKKFWSMIKKISFRQIKLPKIDISEWKLYFFNLLNPKNLNKQPEEPQKTYPVRTIEELDKEISDAEIQQAIDKLKNGKAAGIDGTSPELLKLVKPKVTSYMKKLFNEIYSKSFFPTDWITSIIVPIHKKGSKLITDNYRGISLLSLTSKVFTSIINTRLYNWLEKNEKICTEQAGFRRGFSTTDHIFTLYSMINNCLYGNKRGKFYVAFIDYRKAFDSINRIKLWEALEETGISTKMIEMIKAIYNKVLAKVRFGNKLSEPIECPFGVKQGCLLSPALFSILINKVAKKVASKGRMGYQFIPGGHEIFSLLFADDIVLVSQTPAGLQNQLNNLKQASDELGLEVNLEKTKTISFRRGGYLGRTERWYYGRNKIETVNSYKYLGYTFTTKLSTESALAEVAGKAKNKVISIFKALYKIGKVDIKVFFHLFDCQVRPMLLYAAEIWGNTHESITEKVHMFAARKLLGVNAKTPKTMIYSELNRYPLMIDSNIKTVKYWLKINEMNDSRLPKQAYLREERELNTNRSWGKGIKDLLEKNGFGYVWINQGVTFKKSFLKSLRQRLIDQFWQTWHEKINERPRFNQYKELKENHDSELYLTAITVTKFRKIYTKLRLGILDLQNNKAFYDENINTTCPTCKQKVENEIHFLLECPSYNYYRTKYILKHWPDTSKLTLRELLNTQNPDQIKDIAMYTFYSMKRKEYLLTI